MSENLSETLRRLDREATKPVKDIALNVVAGTYAECSIAEFIRACAVHIEEKQRDILPDTALIGTLCNAVRLARELARTDNSYDDIRELRNHLVELADAWDERERLTTAAENYVAWMRYHSGRIVSCDSDDEGAFKVYRHLMPRQQQVEQLTAEVERLRVQSFRTDLESCRTERDELRAELAACRAADKDSDYKQQLDARIAQIEEQRQEIATLRGQVERLNGVAGLLRVEASARPSIRTEAIPQTSSDHYIVALEGRAERDSNTIAGLEAELSAAKERADNLEQQREMLIAEHASTLVKVVQAAKEREAACIKSHQQTNKTLAEYETANDNLRDLLRRMVEALSALSTAMPDRVYVWEAIGENRWAADPPEDDSYLVAEIDFAALLAEAKKIGGGE